VHTSSGSRYLKDERRGRDMVMGARQRLRMRAVQASARGATTVVVDKSNPWDRDGSERGRVIAAPTSGAVVASRRSGGAWLQADEQAPRAGMLVRKPLGTQKPLAPELDQAKNHGREDGFLFSIFLRIYLLNSKLNIFLV
jgi:hypothetical protein